MTTTSPITYVAILKEEKNSFDFHVSTRLRSGSQCWQIAGEDWRNDSYVWRYASPSAAWVQINTALDGLKGYIGLVIPYEQWMVMKDLPIDWFRSTSAPALIEAAASTSITRGGVHMEESP